VKVIIAGGRDLGAEHHYDLLCEVMERFRLEVAEVVSGKQRGMDTLGEHWAKEHGIPVKPFPADWAAHDLAAGPIRNRQMAVYADFAVVLWTGDLRKSKGSANMLDEMRRAGKPALSWVVR
jgi:hypothetical protein